MASAATNLATKRLHFGKFEADLSTGELRRSGMRVRLQSQPFKLLALLLEHPGEILSREALQHELWGAGTTVDFDHSLGMAVNKLREALGDSAENPRFVETLARRGYRFIAPVSIIDIQAVSVPVVESPPVRSNPPTKFWPWLAIGLAVVCLIQGALLFLR